MPESDSVGMSDAVPAMGVRSSTMYLQTEPKRATGGNDPRLIALRTRHKFEAARLGQAGKDIFERTSTDWAPDGLGPTKTGVLAPEAPLFVELLASGAISGRNSQVPLPTTHGEVSLWR